MIFSAGLGTRFKPWTDKHPKALALVNEKSLLQRNIEYLQQYGIKDVIANVHHFAEQIIDTVKKNNGWGSNIFISDETNELLETGGGLLHAEKLFTAGERFITCNADFLTNLNISKLINFHVENKALISFGVTDRKTSRNLLFNKDYRLIGWRNNSTGELKMAFPSPVGEGLGSDDYYQTPTTASEVRHEMAYSCVVVFEYEIFQLMKEYGFGGKFSLIDVYLKLAPEHLIVGYNHSGDKLVDVGKPESVATAESLFP